jgi:hypothetical protein
MTPGVWFFLPNINTVSNNTTMPFILKKDRHRFKPKVKGEVNGEWGVRKKKD